MNFRIHMMEQRSPEWYLVRCGKLTGAGAQAMLAEGKKKGEEAVTRRDLRLKLACERVTGISQETDFQSKAMEYGTELEQFGRAAVEVATGEMVQECGFIEWDGKNIGCSLDGYSNAFKTIYEIKCPKSATHLAYLREQRIPPEYVRQITHNLYVTGAEKCIFVSYDQRMPEPLRLFACRALRQEFDIAGYEVAAKQFLHEVDNEVRQIQALAQHYEQLHG